MRMAVSSRIDTLDYRHNPPDSKAIRSGSRGMATERADFAGMLVLYAPA
jgi:hypothetical protein